MTWQKVPKSSSREACPRAGGEREFLNPVANRRFGIVADALLDCV
jgi:hypothetical protein